MREGTNGEDKEVGGGQKKRGGVRDKRSDTFLWCQRVSPLTL